VRETKFWHHGRTNDQEVQEREMVFETLAWEL